MRFLHFCRLPTRQKTTFTDFKANEDGSKMRILKKKAKPVREDLSLQPSWKKNSAIGAFFLLKCDRKDRPTSQWANDVHKLRSLPCTHHLVIRGCITLLQSARVFG